MADFVRRSELWTYDVYPKVIGTEKESTIHIRPFGGENFFPAGSVHETAITWLDGGHIEHAPASAFRKELDVTANEENGLDISITFPYANIASASRAKTPTATRKASLSVSMPSPMISSVCIRLSATCICTRIFPTEHMTPRMLPQPIVPTAMIFLP